MNTVWVGWCSKEENGRSLKTADNNGSAPSLRPVDNRTGVWMWMVTIFKGKALKLWHITKGE